MRLPVFCTSKMLHLDLRFYVVCTPSGKRTVRGARFFTGTGPSLFCLLHAIIVEVLSYTTIYWIDGWTYQSWWLAAVVFHATPRHSTRFSLPCCCCRLDDVDERLYLIEPVVPEVRQGPHVVSLIALLGSTGTQISSPFRPTFHLDHRVVRRTTLAWFTGSTGSNTTNFKSIIAWSTDRIGKTKNVSHILNFTIPVLVWIATTTVHNERRPSLSPGGYFLSWTGKTPKKCFGHTLIMVVTIMLCTNGVWCHWKKLSSQLQELSSL